MKEKKLLTWYPSFDLFLHILLARSKWCHSELTPTLAFLASNSCFNFYFFMFVILSWHCFIVYWAPVAVTKSLQTWFQCVAVKFPWLIQIYVSSNMIINPWKILFLDNNSIGPKDDLLMLSLNLLKMLIWNRIRRRLILLCKWRRINWK